MINLFQVPPRYTIDACSLNEFFREHEHRKYPRKTFATLWNKMEEVFNSGEVISHVEVYREIESGNDPEQLKWIRKNRHIFGNYDLPQEGNYIAQIGGKSSLFVHQRKKTPYHADPWLVAQAIINKLVVITEEKDNGRADKIPAICRAFGVRCIDLLDFIVKEKNWTV